MKSALRTLASIVVAVALIALLLNWSGTSTDQILAALAALDPTVYWTAFAIQLTLYPLRAIRTRLLLPQEDKVSTLRLIPATAAHILAAYVLPAKLGEATFVVYLKRACAVPGVRALAVLLVSRILDFAAVIGLLAITCLTLGLSNGDSGPSWLTPLGGVLLLPAALFTWLGIRSERVVPVIHGILTAVGLSKIRLGEKAQDLTGQLEQALQGYKGVQILKGFLITIPVWLLVFLFFGTLAKGFGLDQLSYPEAVFGAGLAILANLLPVNGFAGFGVQDMGWVAGFTSLGVSAELATSSGLAAHLVYAFNISILGFLGQILMGWLGPLNVSPESDSPDSV